MGLDVLAPATLPPGGLALPGFGVWSRLLHDGLGFTHLKI